MCGGLEVRYNSTSQHADINMRLWTEVAVLLCASPSTTRGSLWSHWKQLQDSPETEAHTDRPWPTAADFPGRDSRILATSLPLRTSGRHIVDNSGGRVHFFCVNWYGAHMKQMVMNGLNRRAVADIAADVVRLGFNCVRMPFSLDLVYEKVTKVPDASKTLKANPDLQHLSPLQVFDASVNALTDAGLMVILNNHVSSAGWCCGDFDGEGLWYTSAYPEKDFFDALASMAHRYKGNPLVCGFDLRNEIRSSWSVSPTWGTGDLKTDWSIAATKAGLRVLAENKDMLIIVSALFYGTFLCAVPKNPIHVLVPEFQGRLVYTSHSYVWYSYHFQVIAYVTRYFQILGILACSVWFFSALSWCYPNLFLQVLQMLLPKHAEDFFLG